MLYTAATAPGSGLGYSRCYLGGAALDDGPEVDELVVLVEREVELLAVLRVERTRQPETPDAVEVNTACVTPGLSEFASRCAVDSPVESLPLELLEVDGERHGEALALVAHVGLEARHLLRASDAVLVQQLRRLLAERPEAASSEWQFSISLAVSGLSRRRAKERSSLSTLPT